MKKTWLIFMVAAAIASTQTACKNNTASSSGTSNIDTVITGEVVAELTDAPLVPKPLTYTSPKRVKIELEVIEKVMKIADSTDSWRRTVLELNPVSSHTSAIFCTSECRI